MTMAIIEIIIIMKEIKTKIETKLAHLTRNH